VLHLLDTLFRRNKASADPFFSPRDVVLFGYDVVCYFDGEARRGNARHVYVHAGCIWYFTGDENLNRFKLSPEKFTPQFGGYCAYGLSLGYLAKVDPGAFTIHDGKLYLNYSKKIMHKWRMTISERIQSGERNWPALDPAVRGGKIVW